MAIYSEFSHEQLWFSIAMFNYQRVKTTSCFKMATQPSDFSFWLRGSKGSHFQNGNHTGFHTIRIREKMLDWGLLVRSWWYHSHIPAMSSIFAVYILCIFWWFAKPWRKTGNQGSPKPVKTSYYRNIHKPGTLWVRPFTGWWFGTFFIFPYIRNNHPNWLSYFSEGTNQIYQVASLELPVSPPLWHPACRRWWGFPSSLAAASWYDRNSAWYVAGSKCWPVLVKMAHL